MPLRTATALVLISAVSLGCGDDLSGEEIGCDWLTGANCWKASLQAVTECLPPVEEKGTLSADGRSCSYTQGHLLTFRRPVDMQRLDQQVWDFTLEKDGQSCLSLSEPSETKLVLTTPLGTFLEEAKNMGVQFTCPDGKQYKILDARNMLLCENYQQHIPGVLTGWDEREVAFSFAGSGGAALRIFTCRLAD